MTYLLLIIAMLIAIFTLIIMCANRICDKVFKVEMSLIPIEVQAMGYLKHLDSTVRELYGEINTIKMMLQLQEIKERQQDKPEEKSGEKEN